MHSGWSRFLVHALLTLAALVVAIFVFSFFGGEEIAIGNVVLRAQKGNSYPLEAPPSLIVHPQSREPYGNVSANSSVRNVVLFISDGMGIGHVSAAAALLDHPGSVLAIMDTPFVGLVRTWAANTLITDSAASGTAFATGYKTDKKMVSILPDGSIPRSLFEAAHDQGLLTGVITTSGLADATPACFTTHVAHRDSYDDVLDQMLGSGPAVLVGGDWSNNKKAKRNLRYRELVSDLEELGGARGYHVTRNSDEVAATPLPILALLPPRGGYAEQHGPPLAVSARHVIGLLLERSTGFLLVIESEVTDELAHDNDVEAVMAGMRELDEAVAIVVDLVSERGDTLVLVTADHDTGALSLVDGSYEDEAAAVRWSSGEHTSQWVPLFAFGPGSQAFTGVLDNTDVAARIAGILGLEPFPIMTDFGQN